MGMYSYVKECDITICNPEGLKEYVLRVLQGNMGDMWEEDVRSLLSRKHAEKTVKQLKRIPAEKLFNNEFGWRWDGWKIIQYWYPGFATLIRDISAFVDGYVELQYETEEEMARIIFQNGETKIECGRVEITWEDVSKDVYERRAYEEDEFVKRARELKKI